MLYTFYGKNQSLVREKARAHIKTLTENTADITRISDAEYTDGILNDLAEGVSLFGGEQVVLIETPSSAMEFKEAVLESLPLLKDSKNHFVITEGSLLAADKKVYAKYSDILEESASIAEEKYNVFALCDALLERDKKRLWMLFQETEGIASEEIVGILFWQMKMLRLAERTDSPEEAGQKSFTYNKAKRAVSKFAKGEVDALTKKLVLLYHEGHGGKVDMRFALEKWILQI